MQQSIQSKGSCFKKKVRLLVLRKAGEEVLLVCFGTRRGRDKGIGPVDFLS